MRTISVQAAAAVRTARSERRSIDAPSPDISRELLHHEQADLPDDPLTVPHQHIRAIDEVKDHERFKNASAVAPRSNPPMQPRAECQRI